MGLMLDKASVYCHIDPIDMRRGFDLLHEIVKHGLGKNIFDNILVLFVNKSRDKAKVLYWDGTGLVILYKRLEKGQFTNFKRRASNEIRMTVNELQLFLEGTRLEKYLPLSAESMDTERFL